jgi:hypothetical protein
MSQTESINFLKAIGSIAIIIIFLIIIFRGINYSNKSPIKHNKRICLENKRTTYEGIIVMSWYSKGEYMSKLKNGSIFEWRCSKRINEIIENGDSIFKPSGTFNTYIYKRANPDSVIFIECDFDCDYWEKRYGEKMKNLGW